MNYLGSRLHDLLRRNPKLWGNQLLYVADCLCRLTPYTNPGAQAVVAARGDRLGYEG